MPVDLLSSLAQLFQIKDLALQSPAGGQTSRYVGMVVRIGVAQLPFESDVAEEFGHARSIVDESSASLGR